MRGHRRAARPFAIIVAIAALLGAGVLPASAATAVKPPKVTVTPSSKLVPGQTVHVKGSGFPRNSQIDGTECLRGTTDFFACDFGAFIDVASDADGNIATTFTVHRTLLGERGFTDCGVSGCELLFAPDADGGNAATADIAFDPKAPLPKTMLTATPATQLKDDQQVRVRGSGFTADAHGFDEVEVVECLVVDFQCTISSAEAEPAHGKFSLRTPVRRELVDSEGSRVDCARSKKACEMVAIDIVDVDYHAIVPIAFDPSLSPPPPATLTVKPDTKLPYYARVDVSGRHWAPNDFVFLTECAGSGIDTCAFTGFAITDARGALAGSPMLQRELPDLFDSGGPPTDCAIASSACTLMVQGSDGSVATVPLRFDPHAPIPPPPTVTVSPAPPYRNGQTVHVKGKHFAPNAEFNFTECFTATRGHEIESGCGEIGSEQTTSANGALSGATQVFRKFDDGERILDCNNPQVQCTFEVSSEGGATVQLPLRFTGGGSDAVGRVVPGATSSRPSWVAAATSRAVMARAALPRPLLTELGR